MSMLNNKLVVGFIVGFLISFFMARSLFRETKTVITEGDKTVEVRLVTKIDTVYIPQNVYVLDSVKVTLVKTDTIYKPNTREVATIPAIKRVYADSIRVDDSTYIGYKAHVTGTLDNMKLSYSNRKSIVVIHRQDSIISNTVVTKPSRGLYLGVEGGLQELSPTLMYNAGKNNYGVKYNLVNQGFGLTYSRRIF